MKNKKVFILISLVVAFIIFAALAINIFTQPNPTGIPSATTNVKYVYDGSDYTKFKKQQAVNRNYNDYSYGGAGGSNTFIALNRVRR